MPVFRLDIVDASVEAWAVTSIKISGWVRAGSEMEARALFAYARMIGAAQVSAWDLKIFPAWLSPAATSCLPSTDHQDLTPGEILLDDDNRFLAFE